jgi:hypothetical protein
MGQEELGRADLQHAAQLAARPSKNLDLQNGIR